MEEEKKKEGFFRRIEKDFKLQMGCFLFCMSIVMIIYLFSSTYIRNQKIFEIPIKNHTNIFVNIKEVNNTENEIEILGWTVLLNSELEDIYVIFSPENSEISKEELVKVETKEDSVALQNYMTYLKTENLSGTNFVAKIRKNKLEKDVCYEVLVYVKNKEGTTAKLSSKTYLYQEELYSYNPLQITTPTFIDAEMREIVEHGKMMSYDIEHEAWVYFYKNNLYWILDKKIETNLADGLRIFFHLYTTTPELLPEYRQQSGVDNRDFIFHTRELIVDDNYRVAMIPLEMEYAITYVRTGEYNIEMQKDIWSTWFCPLVGLGEEE